MTPRSHPLADLLAQHLSELPPGVHALVLALRAGESEAETLRQLLAGPADVALLRGVLDSLPLLVSHITADERYGLANSMFEAWFGIARERLLGRPLREVIGEAAYARLGPQIARGLAGERFSFEQVAVPYRHGGTRDIRVELMPARTVDGQPNGYIALLQDVTERRRLEAEREAALRDEQAALAVAQSERDRQHLLFMQAPVAIAFLEGPAHVFTLANPAYRALVDGRDVVGLPLLEALPDVQGQGFAALLDEVKRTGESHVGTEVPVKLTHHAAGERLIMNFVYTPRRNAQGEVEGVMMSGIDVTHQVLARQRVEALATQLQRSEERVRQVVEAAAVGLWDLDLATGAIAADLRFRDQLAIGADEPLTLERKLQAIHPEDRARVAAALAAPLTQGQGRIHLEFRRSGRGLCWLESRAQVTFGPDGVATRVAGALLDVTDRKTAEAHRERTRKVEAELRRVAESANRTKDRFMAMLGHELRNPLAPIVTALQLMDLRDQGQFTRERGIIGRQVEHLARLVDDLLDVARITTGKVQLHRLRVDLRSVVETALETVAPLIADRRHTLELDLAADGTDVDGDADRLRQVVSNLVTNAAKYTEPGGHIRVRLAREAELVVLTVQDSGIGIEPAMLTQVFELFAQEPQSIDRARGGLGLGLAIVHSLVTMHGGTVRASSPGLGLGTELVVRLPAADGTAALDPPAPSATPSPRPALAAPLRILVVDDNVDAAELLGEMLAVAGHDVRVTHAGVEALAAATHAPPDVAILDIGLPEMDGFELARRFRSDPRLAGVRLVALTGYGQDGDRRASREAGFDEHLVKPVDLRRLTAALRSST